MTHSAINALAAKEKLGSYAQVSLGKPKNEALELLKDFQEHQDSQSDTLSLTGQDAKVFTDALINPPEPNEALKEAAHGLTDEQIEEAAQQVIRDLQEKRKLEPRIFGVEKEFLEGYVPGERNREISIDFPNGLKYRNPG